MNDEAQFNSDVVKHRIALARRAITSDKGVVKRRRIAITIAHCDIHEANDRIGRNKALIRELGGKVRS